MSILTFTASDSLAYSDQLAATHAHTIPSTGRHTLIYAKNLMEGRHGWFLDDYTPQIAVHYGEEGTNIHSVLCGGIDGGIYLLDGESDNGSPVSCRISTECRDQGDTRLNKLYGDVMLDCQTGSVNVTATPYFNNYQVSAPDVIVNTGINRAQISVPVGPEWITARNIALDLNWQMNGVRSYFYIWEPRYTEEGGKVFAYDWETCFLTHELPGYFYHGYLYLVHISAADLTFTITGEDGTVAASVTLLSSGGLHHKDFIRLPVVKGKIFKYRISSSCSVQN